MEKDYKISLLLDFYGELLSQKQRLAIEGYYNEDCSLAEIAQEMGITRQAVRDIIKRTEQTLLQMEIKLGLYSRFEEMQRGLEKIKSLSGNIIGLTDNDDIKAAAAQITDCANALLEKQE
ncbi:DNA-binding protein [Ruminococcus sp. zg-924]|nr:DNA-binding protein [Ruminococcus sp. zg-924]MCQ4115461.1 DNA-binding protein [Ruminococcus sp. zg-921]